jgi:hypothetical protein
MKLVPLFIFCFLFFVLCVLSKADIVSRHYAMELSHEDTVSNGSLMTEYNSESLINCGAMCSEFCACFDFDPKLKKCRIHMSCGPPDMTVADGRWQYCYGIYTALNLVLVKRGDYLP